MSWEWRGEEEVKETDKKKKKKQKTWEQVDSDLVCQKEIGLFQVDVF